MKGSILLILLLLSSFAMAQKSFRIAFGSCSSQESEEQMWNEVVSSKPDLWIWSGDNIYGDSYPFDLLETKYNKQKARPSYQRLLQTCPITGTWDDHDYGTNDGGKYFVKKNESKRLAANFLGFAQENTVWLHEGLYNSTVVKKKKTTIKIINLDTRYFRDTIYKKLYVDTLTNKRVSYYEKNLTGDLLGEAQWNWLEDELRKSTSSLNIINSSIQVMAEEHRFEKWSNLPAAQKRLYDLLQRYPEKRVIIISGDRHIAEISKRSLPALHYPLYDFTSSGLTHTWSEVWIENNAHRVGKLIIEKNFALIDVTVVGKQLKITFSVMGKDGIVYEKQEVEL